MAQTTPAPAASPSASPSPSPTPRAWQASGYAATSFNASSHPGGSGFAFANGAPSRTFDTLDRQPMLNAVNVQLVKTGTIGGKIELTAGTNADVIASYPTANNDSFDVTQAYLSYTGGPFTLIAGKFSTLAGAEVIEDPANVNVSRSILFGFAVPFTHTGARLTYAPSAAWSLIGGVNDGWDDTKGNGTGAKTAEAGIAYNGTVISVAAQGYSGTERISNAAWTFFPATPIGHRSLIDVVGTYHATPRLTFQANFDSGQQQNVPLVDGAGAATGIVGSASWNGVAGYATYQLTPKLSAALRSETFGDAGGYRTGYDQRWRETTLTFAYAPSAPLLFRLEGRADSSNRGIWIASGGLPATSLQSIAVQALVKF
ncbi:MAG TPA: outer membrane beta-barrel protein [Candidatus Elarobacter sp.]|nr:outer membrane beta-barrel protein [Candidatus Elarobacter sp.]